MAKAPAILGVLALPNNRDASRPFQKLLHAPCGLPDPLLVLDQRDPHEPLAFLTKAPARRHRDDRLGQQPFGEFHRTQVPEGPRYLRPGDHAALGRRNFPTHPPQALPPPDPPPPTTSAVCRGRVPGSLDR